MKRRHIRKAAKLLTGLTIAILASMHINAHAGPAEDMEEARIAFNRGDVVSAMALYRSAAEAGNSTAMARLAYLLDQSEQNEEAVEWYEKSAAMDDPEGKYGLAEMYVSGDAGIQDFEKATKLILEAAEAGHHSAIQSLAVAYERGGLGLQINQEKVIYWLEQGAAKGDRWSIDRLVNAYRKGETGLQPDEEKAAYWADRLKNLKD